MNVLASSFADGADRRAYEAALISFLRGGMSQSTAEFMARKVGDPGIGWMDNDLTDESIPWIALPYEDWHDKWERKGRAHNRKVRVKCNGIEHVCLLGDTMEHKARIENGAGIDFAPGAQKAFKLTAPFMVPAEWEWED